MKLIRLIDINQYSLNIYIFIYPSQYNDDYNDICEDQGHMLQ